jgi:hypothetical protein
MPVLFWSEMVQQWVGYTAPTFPLSDQIPAIIGTVIFFYGACRSFAAVSAKSGPCARPDAAHRHGYHPWFVASIANLSAERFRAQFRGVALTDPT